MTSLLDYALCSLEDVKELLGIDSGDTSKDNIIRRRINQATVMIERYCGGRRFKATNYTDIELDATNSDQITLDQYPIISFTSLASRDGGLNEDNWDTTEADRYFVDDEAGVVDLTYTARGGWNRYRATFRAGYETIPSDLQEACATLAAYLVENGTSGTGVKKKQEGSRSIEYFDANASSNNDIFSQLNIDDILNTYAKYPISEK